MNSFSSAINNLEDTGAMSTWIVVSVENLNKGGLYLVQEVNE